MNNKLFASQGGIPKIDPSQITTNAAGGVAVSMSDTNALAQMAMTGCFNDTFYTDPTQQLETLKKIIARVDTADLADITVCASLYGHMKDMPVYLLASILTRGETKVFRELFPIVIHSLKDLRNFVMVMRSGQVGRRSLGYAAKKACQRWLEARSATALFRQSYGNDPSFADLIHMIHPKTMRPEQNALYGWFTDRDYQEDMLPAITRQFIAFCRGENVKIPTLPLPMLMGHNITDSQWKELALTVSWTTLRMNLNNFHKHGAFNDTSVRNRVCARLVDASELERARIFPYQLYTAIKFAADDMPRPILLALNDAIELSVKNVPVFPDDTIVALDISGSMNHPITGIRKGATTHITCSEVGSIMAATALKANPNITVLGFGQSLYDYTKHLNPRDSVLTIAQHMYNRNEGTDCSLPLKYILEGHKCKLLYMISDNESWIHGIRCNMWGADVPNTVDMWNRIRKHGNSQNALFVCNDLIPNVSSPMAGEGILHVAGYSDKIWNIVIEWLGHNGKVDYMSIIRNYAKFMRTPITIVENVTIKRGASEFNVPDISEDSDE